MSSLMKKAGLIFDENKVKPFLKMSITRFNLLVNKKANHIKIGKKEIARLLADGKEEKARIKVEQIIREDFTIEAYDILELHCELLAERMRLIASQKEVPPDLDQAVCTLIWAADRAEVSELSTVKSQFQKKYGQEYVRAAELNDLGCVNPKVVEKLDCQPPSGFVVTEYLVSIAEEYDIDFTPAIPIRRKSTEDTEAAAIAAAAAAPRPAYETPPHQPPVVGSDNTGGHGGAGGGGGGGGGGGVGHGGGGYGGGGGISSPPSVTAWAVPSESIPHVAATLPPRPSPGGEGGASAAGPTPAPYVPIEKSGYQDAGRGRRRPSGGFEEATMGWGPGDAERKSDVAGHGEEAGGDAPPPYSPPRAYNHHDIPSPPRTKPMPFDIPAAPGYEDPPVKGTSGGDHGDGSGDGDGGDPPASAGGGSDMDDLAARFMNLRK